MKVVFEKEGERLAVELQQVLDQHGFDYEAPAWRQLIQRADAAGFDFVLPRPFWMEILE